LGGDAGGVGDDTRGKYLIGLKMLVALGLGLGALVPISVPGLGVVLALPLSWDVLDGNIEGLEEERTSVITS
jgi:hypothetical protein